ncbi:MAG: CapA family protein [Clostridia bacterium]|nr:CapA family protein [Clostridia bacterium]
MRKSWCLQFFVLFSFGMLLWLFSGALGEEIGFQVHAPKEGISGYQSNPLTITAPEAGQVSLEIWDETTLYRILDKEVPAGKSQIVWDGLGWNEERMAQKSYTIRGSLQGASGQEYAAQTAIRVIPAQQAILFALPSDPEVYLQDATDWFLEFKLLYTDQLVAQFFDGETDALVLQTSRQAKGARVNQISYPMLTGKHALAAGTYRVLVFGAQHPSYAKEFSITIHEGKRPELPLQLTGDIMPTREDTDAEIWAKMMAPAAVIDIANVAHQRVYAEPDSSSKVLGTLHGQSQSLSVLEIGEKWVRISAWNHEKGAQVEGWIPKKVIKVVQPQSEYGLLVDKKYQTLTVYHWGEKIDTLLVSTGRMQKGELYQETAAGSFLTNFHMSDYSTNGLKYDFVIRYDGGNLLHQIPYAWNESGKKDMLPGEMYLGTKASHACIRVQEKPSEQGINAYWFWTHLPYHTRIIVMDDPEERIWLENRITGNTPNLMEGLQNAWQVEPESEEEEAINISFGGDVVLGGRESYYGDPEGMPAYLEKEGFDWPFAGLKSLFLKDDFTVVNLEGVLKDDGAGEDLTKQWRFRGLTSYAQALQAGGIELVNLANNHTIDYGEEGYRSTQEALEGVAAYCGNGVNRVIDIQGHLFGFGGCRETTYRQDPGIIGRDVEEMKAQGAEFIIYQCHWGTEYEELHNALQEAMARACKRAGVDLVIGHHPHVVQGMDWMDGMPVVYSLGNLVFGGTIKLTTYDALIAQAKFYPERTENRIEIRLIPILTSSLAEKKINNYQPSIAYDEDALRILQKIQKDTGWLLTERVLLNY